MPNEDCLKLLSEAMDAEARLAIVCPQYPDETVGVLSMLHGVQQIRRRPQPRGMVEKVDVPHGTLMLVRRVALAEVGLFDERFFAYGDEHELGVRARRKGWSVGLVWGASVTNPGTWTSSPLRSYFFTRNSLMLVRSEYGSWGTALRALLIFLNIARQALRRQTADFAFSAQAQWRGLADYYRGRFGLPSWIQ